MTRNLLFFCFLFFLFYTECHSQPITVKEDTVIKVADMKGNMWKEWYTLDTTWLKNMFPSCLHENRLALNCGDCESIYLIVQMKIDSTGKLIKYIKTKEKMCGSNFTELLEKCFLDFFLFLEFPADFRNKTIEVRLGDGLKC